MTQTNQQQQQNGNTPPWYGEIPAERKDLSEWVNNKGFKDPIAALESNMNLEKLIGADKAGRTIILPKDDKDAEGLKAFHAKLGVPEAPDKYELPSFKQSDGSETEDSKAFVAEAGKWFHANGVPKAAAQKIMGAWNEHLTNFMKASDETFKAEAAKQLDSLRGEWGNDFDKKAEFARRFLKEAGWSDEKLAEYEKAFGTADMLKTFHAFGAKTAEHGFAGGGGSGTGGGVGMSVEDARTKLETMRAERQSGKITDRQWSDGKEKEFLDLSAYIQSKQSARK